MVPEFLLYGLISLGVGLLALCEWVYLRHAPLIGARITRRELGASQERIIAQSLDFDGVSGGDAWESALIRKQRVLYYVRVRLDPDQSDGRVVQVPIDRPFYDAVKSGDSFRIQALPHRPRWLFWSDMVRKPRWWMHIRTMIVVPVALSLGSLCIWLSYAAVD